MKPEGTLIVIAGPTASGKSNLAMSLAEHLKCDIINADARQMVRKMDIGTAKPNAVDRNRVRHHFIDILEPDEHYSAGRFSKDLRVFLDAYFQSNRLAILCGGSGLYLKAATEGFDNLPEALPETRARWRNVLNKQGISALQEAVRKRDPEFALNSDMGNPQRLQRALEVMETTGVKISELRKNIKDPIAARVLKFFLNPPRSWLYERINIRVDIMMKQGLLNEVEQLTPYCDSNALKTVGYSELFDYLDGKRKLEEAVEKIKQHTRNYAKRQYTWFKAQADYTAIENTDPDEQLRHLLDHLRV